MIQNLVAGRSDAEGARPRIEGYLLEVGCEYQLYITEDGEALHEVDYRAVDKGFNLFLVAGGQGTVSGVVDGYMIGYAPKVVQLQADGVPAIAPIG